MTSDPVIDNWNQGSEGLPSSSAACCDPRCDPRKSPGPEPWGVGLCLVSQLGRNKLEVRNYQSGLLKSPTGSMWI